MAPPATNTRCRGQAGHYDTRIYYPVLDTFMMALPHTIATQPPCGHCYTSKYQREGGGNWFLAHEDRWILSKTNDRPVAAHTTIDGSVAWKLFTKSWRRKDIESVYNNGRRSPAGGTALNMIAVMPDRCYRSKITVPFCIVAVDRQTGTGSPDKNTFFCWLPL